MKKLLLIMLLACSWMGWGQAGTKPVLKGAIWVAQATPPASPSLNEVYRATDGLLRRWNGSSWVVDSGSTTWASLTGVPAGFADGIDNDTQLNNAQVETAYNAQVAVVTQPIAELGTSTTVYRWTPERIKQAILALAPAGASGHIIQDEGVAETARTNLNFVGPQVNVTDDAGNNATVVTITGDGTGTDDQTAAEVNIADAGGNFDATTVEGALAEIVDFAPTEITVNTTLTAAHLNRILWNDSGGELEVTVPSTIGVDGDFIYLMTRTTNSALKPLAGSGTTFVNLYKTATVAGSVLKYVRINGAWIATGDTFDQATAYTLVTNLYTLANAANPQSEANATTGVSSTDGSIASVSSPTAHNGTYSVQFTRTLAGGNAAYADINLTSLPTGTPMTINIWFYPEHSDQAVYLFTADGWSVALNSSGHTLNAWNLVTFSGVSTSNATARIRLRQGTSGLPGEIMRYDDVTITAD